MVKIELIIDHIDVILTEGTDRIAIRTNNFPSTLPKVVSTPLEFTILAEYDTGVDYVRKNFLIEPRNVVDTRTIRTESIKNF